MLECDNDDTKVMSDPIKPSHYKAVDGSETDCHIAQLAMMGTEQMRGYHRGNILKYLWRYMRKNGVEDLQKAREHISMLIELESR